MIFLCFVDPSVTSFSESSGLYIQENVGIDLVLNVEVTNVAVGQNNQILEALASNINYILNLSFSNSVQNMFFASERVTLSSTTEKSALAAGGKFQ